MQTHLDPEIAATQLGKEAGDILRSCVHCGFCIATCPTYQLIGDELDSPRGRIYLIKQVMEGHVPTATTQLHLDRCLSCRSCETTCPSGVQYGRLLDIGRNLVDSQLKRRWWDRLLRWALSRVISKQVLLRSLLSFATWFKFLLPSSIGKYAHSVSDKELWPDPQHTRRMIMLEGCAQSAMAPEINRMTARVFDRLGISILREPKVECCAAVSHHLTQTQYAEQTIRHNIDTWWPYVDQGIEAIVITASGCVPMVKEYAQLMQQDEKYSEKAQVISSLAKDISEIILEEEVWRNIKLEKKPKLAFHSPCTLQHGLKLNGVVEDILQRCGFNLTKVKDSHLCCGAAGTYSLLQPKLSQALLMNKLIHLQHGKAELIATANIGCLLHMRSRSSLPIKHWIELLDTAL